MDTGKENNMNNEEKILEMLEQLSDKVDQIGTG